MDDYCGPFKQCVNLDGRLLITQTLEGPTLAVSGAEMALGPVKVQKPVLRPYIRLFYEQQWIPKEICTGLVRSIIGLGPAETMNLETRTVDQWDYVRMVQNAVESSETTSSSRSHARELVDDGFLGNLIDLGSIKVRSNGSILEDVGDFISDTATSVYDRAKDFVEDTKDLIEDFLGLDGSGGAGSSNDRSLSVIDESLESIVRTNSQRTVTETTTSRSNTVERSVTRTFTNPYANRSMQLRFIPVFRTFDVVTTFIKIEWGLVLGLGKVRFPNDVSSVLADFVQRRVADPRILSLSTSELGLDDVPQTKLSHPVKTSAVAAYLNANAEYYGPRYLLHLQAQRGQLSLRQLVFEVLRGQKSKKLDTKAQDLADVMAWSQAYVHGPSVVIPSAPLDVIRKHLPVKPQLRDEFIKTLGKIGAQIRVIKRTRQVHLFMGTHVEASPGNCALPGIS